MKLAVFQMEAVCGDPESNLRLIETAMAEASGKGADLLLTPELAISGYGAGEALHKIAQPADGAWSDRLKQKAMQTGVSVIAGFPERSGDDVYNSAMFVDAGATASPTVYRKSHLYADYEKSLFRSLQPETVLVDHKGIKLGLLICYDVEFPENVRRLALAGAEAVLVPTALPESSHAAFIAKKVIAVRAFENQVFVAYGNHAGCDENFVYAGLSHIAAPDGETLALAADNKPALLFAEFIPSRYAASKSENSYLADLKPGG